MKRFDQLTPRGRIQRLKRVALIGLEAHYGIVPSKTLILAQTDNLVLRIVDKTGTSSILRLYFKGDAEGFMVHQTDAEKRSELQFLQALSDAGFCVPTPIPNNDGNLISTIHAAHLTPDTWQVALFSWVVGRFYDDTLTSSQLYRVGEFQARFHNFSEQYTPPKGFHRWSWDSQRYMREGSAFTVGKLSAYFDDKERAHGLRYAGEKIASFMDELPRDNTHYGIIHSDLHQWNYLFNGDGVCAIDWGDCGWGHYLFDVGSTLYYLRRRDDFAFLRDALLEGYAQHRVLPDNVLMQIDMFLHLRYIDLISWVSSSAEMRDEYRNAPIMDAWCHDLIVFGHR